MVLNVYKGRRIQRRRELSAVGGRGGGASLSVYKDLYENVPYINWPTTLILGGQNILWPPTFYWGGGGGGMASRPSFLRHCNSRMIAHRILGSEQEYFVCIWWTFSQWMALGHFMYRC